MISFVVAAHNEEESLPILLAEIRAAAQGSEYEIVIVNDGSSDTTGALLDADAKNHDDLRPIHFRTNHGQSAAMSIGIEESRGDILVTMDADLQNDPADHKLLLAALEGNDLACGVRARRKDTWRKRIGSRFANWVRRSLLPGDDFRDVGCTLKAWRREVALRIPKFHGFHRFIPILARSEGYKVVEVEVSHRAREHGQTHYGNLGRAISGFRDLLGTRWLLKRRRPVSGARASVIR